MAREMPLPMRLACILPTDVAPGTAKMIRKYRVKLSLADLAPTTSFFNQSYSEAIGYLDALHDADLIDFDAWKALLDEAVVLLKRWRPPAQNQD
ncbi:hypothetical protein [Pseudomonas putida]|uniref:Uncharacterized protein n=1 Tax=Pseudomonas putida TaxID=303 RepID=A0A8I1EBM0_PSEPU|nr:hypothetical protein [Pseudomonas putida]MBI6882521.1 hypothetical protein [Pseudomonas putida]